MVTNGRFVRNSRRSVMNAKWGAALAVAVGLGCGEPRATEVLATPEAVLSPEAPDEAKVEVVKVSFDEMVKKIASNKKAKYTLVDAWATWCGPCKENFPHVVEMHKKYGEKGLAVCSLSMDDGKESKEVAEVLKFLKSQDAVFTNFVANDPEEMFEKFDIVGIPAVFLFGPDGKIVRRFTMDDVNNQFTYEQVEEELEKLIK
jgi:thiol-disulfide isomerase/thioredoxin